MTEQFRHTANDFVRVKSFLGGIPMLVLTRKIGESIVIDDHIEVRVQQLTGKRVRISIDAPNHVKIMRGEIAERVTSDWQEAETV